MGSLLPIGFAAPWVLAALAALPVLWWLLRTTPPQPAHVKFPALTHCCFPFATKRKRRSTHHGG